MAEDWAIDVKKYVPDADDAVIAAIVRYCGIALRKRDSSLVSFSDPKETGRVRDNFCRKKLGLTDPDEAIDAEIAKIGQRMKGDTTKNRVTVYYLLAEAYGKLGLFGGTAKMSAAVPVAAAGGLAAASAAAPTDVAGGATDAAMVAAPLAAAGGIAAATAAPVEASEPVPAMAASPTVAPLASGQDHDPTPPHHPTARARGSDGFGGIALATLAGMGVIVLGAAVVTGFVNSDLPPTELPAYAGPDTSTAAGVAAAPAPAAPQGAGVTAQVVDGMPKVSVYFDTGKTDIAPDFATVAGPIKAWADANPGDRIGVSGFNDPTGNAALNAELSKNRAQAVAAALGAIGVPADRIDLDKPPETTDTGGDLSQARRVDIFIKDGG